MIAIVVPHSPWSSTQAIWTRSSLPSVDALGSSSNAGSSQIQRCRSVNRTPSGSTSGCFAASCSAMSSASSHLSVMSQLLQAALGHRLVQRAIHDPPGKRLTHPAERLDGVANGEVGLPDPERLEALDPGPDLLALGRLQQGRRAGELLAGGVEDHVGLHPRLPHLALLDVRLRMVERLLEHALDLLVGEAVGRL